MYVHAYMRTQSLHLALSLEITPNGPQFIDHLQCWISDWS